MKTVTYQTSEGPKTIEYDENYPCIMCGLPVMDASMGGTVVCPWCDCGVNRDGTKWSGDDCSRRFRNAERWHKARENLRHSVEYQEWLQREA